MAPDEAFRILTNGRGVHWDGNFVEVFIGMMRREGTGLLIARPRPPQLAVTGLLERPVVVDLAARD
jgi:hypothetical protein